MPWVDSTFASAAGCHMSAEISPGPATSLVFSPDQRRVLRYALGATMAMALALSVVWPLSYLTPVLSLGFLAAPTRLGFKMGVGFVGVVILSCLVGLVLAEYLLPFPLVYLPLIGLCLLHLFYAKAKGTSPLVITWLLISILVLPLVAMQAPRAAFLVAAGLVAGATVMVLLVWFTWFLVPEYETTSAKQAPAATAKAPAASAPLRDALMGLCVVFPALVAFYTLQWTGSLLVLIFIAILSMQPGVSGNVKAGKALIIGNIFGGLVSILFYETLVMMPSFPFMTLLVLLCGLFFGTQLFSTNKMAPLYGMAFSTVLLIIGSTTSSDAEAGNKVITRVMQMSAAVLYVVAAFWLLDRLTRRKEIGRAHV